MLHTTHKVRAQLTKAGHIRLTEVRHMNCWLRHQCLEARKSAWQDRQETLSLYEQHKVLTALRQSEPKWQGLDNRRARGALQRLDRAYQSFFRWAKTDGKMGRPRLKSHLRWRALEVADPAPGMLQGTVERSWLWLKDLPRSKLDVRGRPLPPKETLQGIRIIRKARRTAVHLAFALGAGPGPVQPIGIELGIKVQAVLS